jgi:CysZ protein
MASTAPVTSPATRPGFFDGTRALFSGFWFVMRTPPVWPLAMVPVAIAGLVTAAVTGGVLRVLVPRIAVAFGPRLGFLATLVDIVIAILALIVAGLLGFGIAQPLSGPALNRIVRRAEAEVGAAAWPASGVVEDVGRALQSIAISYAVGLPILTVLYVITLAFPPAAVVTFPVKLLVLALLVAWDLCDYPLSIHGMPVADRVAFVGRNLGAMLGFGFGLALLSMVPCLMVFVLPAGVAGAAMLTRRIEQFETRG